MPNFNYLPELSVELSKNAPVALEYKSKTLNWNEKTFVLNGENKNIKYIDFLEDKNKFDSITVRTTPYTKKQDVYIVPNSEVNKKLYEKFGNFMLFPMVLPPALKTTDEIVKYIVDRGLLHDYSSDFPPEGFQMEPHISYGNKKEAIYSFTKSMHMSPWLKGANKQTVQKKILHTIVFNEFFVYAEKNNDYDITFGEFLNDKNNIATIKDKFTRFELTEHTYRDTINDYFVKNTGMPSSPLKYNVLSTVARRETAKKLSARNALNIVLAGAGAVPKEKKEWEKFRVEVKSNTYGIEEVLENTFASLSNDTSAGFKFNSDNVIPSSNIFLGARINTIISELGDNLSPKDKNEILTLSQSLYDMIKEEKWHYQDSLSTIYNALGYDYLATQIKPTNLMALCRLFLKPSQTLRTSSYLNNISAFITNNLENEKDEEVSLRAKNYSCDFVYEIVMHNSNVVAYKDMLDMDFSAITNEYSTDVEDVTPAMVGNILFTNSELVSGNKYESSPSIERLRTLGF